MEFARELQELSLSDGVRMLNVCDWLHRAVVEIRPEAVLLWVEALERRYQQMDLYRRELTQLALITRVDHSKT